jgi:granule-bound starch synthase
MEKQIEELEVTYPGKAIGVAKFNSPLAHKIIAGADFIVIPSRFEPCGLVQLHAMPYGTVEFMCPFFSIIVGESHYPINIGLLAL